MKYIYKTVSLEDFLSNQTASKIGAMDWQTQKGMAQKASRAIENLINYYAKDGWEYVRSEEFRADFFKTGFASFFNDSNPLLQMFIFRQEHTEELSLRLESEAKENLQVRSHVAEEGNSIPSGSRSSQLERRIQAALKK